MTPDALSHQLTDEERCHFEEHGYLVVENALSSEQVVQLSDAVDQIHNEALESGRAEEGKQWGFSDFLGKDDAFFDLVECPTTLPKVWGILGWNIYLCHARSDP